MIAKYRLIDYFDIWYDSDGLWEVNNLCCIEENCMIDPDSTDSELIDFLVRIGYLNEKANTDTIEVVASDDCYMEFFERETQKPICRLEKAQ